MLDKDDIVDLLCIAKGNNDAPTKKAANAAIGAAMGLLLAEGGNSWDFQKERISFSLIADRSIYKVNRKPSATDSETLYLDSQAPGRIQIIHDVWYNKRRVRIKTPDVFRVNYQGVTTTGEPLYCTAYGNTFEVGPIPGGAYTIYLWVSKFPASIADFPINQRFAIAYQALPLMFSPGSTEYAKGKDQLDMAIKAVRQSDGLLDLSSHIEGGFEDDDELIQEPLYTDP